MRHLLITALVLSAGCVRFEDHFSDQLSAEGVYAVDALMERGRLEYRGQSEETFDISGVSWGYSSGRDIAERNENANRWSWEVRYSTLFVDASTEYVNAGVDVEVRGPDVMDVRASVDWGSVHLQDAEGAHVVSAGYITSERIIGDVDFFADGGMDVEIWPWLGGVVSLEAHGDVVLRLPYGGGYNIEVWGDSRYPMEIADLGWDEEAFGDGYYAAERWPGDILIQVNVQDGGFDLRESW